MSLSFHHLGLAVKNAKNAERFLNSLGYRLLDVVYDPLQQVNLRMCEHGAMPDIELIWPQGDAASPLGGMLKKRDGLVYHMCYTAENAEAAVAGIEALGVRALPLGEAKPAVLFGGKLVSFYQLDGIGMIEIIHGR